MKANNFEELSNNIPNEWGVKISQEIEEAEKDLFHVVIVNRTHIPSQERYTTKAYVQKFNEQAWNNTKSLLPSLGYTRCFILHDPTKKVVVKAAVKKEEA